MNRPPAMTSLRDAIADAFVEIAHSIPELRVDFAYHGSRRMAGAARPVAGTIRNAIATEEDGAEELGDNAASPTVPRVWVLRVLAADWPEVTPPEPSDEVAFTAMDGAEVRGAVASLRRRFAYYEITVRRRDGGRNA